MAAATPAPLIEIAGLRKQYGALRPLRVNSLSLGAGDRMTLHGLDAEAAEMLTLLITGASLPDEGTVNIAGRDTRDIQTDTEWLTSLDVFGMVTTRAALMESVAVEANMALPFTLSIDPLDPDVRRSVHSLAAEVELAVELLPAPIDRLGASERARVHLARALALNPQVLLLEHPTARLAPAEAGAFGQLLATIGERRKLGWLALTEDDAFSSAAGGRRCRLIPATGDITTSRRSWRIW
jgi:ABC-type transporter Mla maintaining outer membrane lipid asymmetry ATPase subunit MlaF